MPIRKHESVYRILLKDAALITWRNKFLWIFGFFLALSGQSGLYDVLLRNWSKWLGRGLAIAAGPVPWPHIPTQGLSLGSIPTGVIMVSLLAIVLFALAIFLAMVSVGGLVGSARRAVRGVKLSFRTGWHIGLASFWSVLAIGLLTYLLLNLSFVVVAWPTILIATHSTVINILIFVAAYLVFLPVTLTIAFVGLYSVCEVIIHGCGPADAVVHAWHLYRKNIVLSVEMGIALFAVTLVGSLAVLLGAVILLFPFLLGAAVTYMFGALTATAALMGIAAVTFFAATLVAGSFLAAYQVIAWTLLYERIREKAILPKLVRILHSLPGYLVPKSR